MARVFHLSLLARHCRFLPQQVLRTTVLAVGLWTGIAPGVLANVTDAPEAISIPSNTLMALPDELRPALLMLRDRLNRLDGVEAEIIEAAEGFIDVLEDDPEFFETDFANLSQEDAARLGNVISDFRPVLEALRPVAEAMAGQDWLQRANPEIARQLVETCGRQRNADERDLFDLAPLLSADRAVDEDARIILDDLDSTVRECVDVAVRYGAAFEAEYARLDAEIERIDRELETTTDPVAIERLEAEKRAAQEQQREMESGNFLQGLLSFLLGAVQFAAGLIGVIASGGSCGQCYIDMGLGATAMDQGWQMMEGGSVPEPITTPARYSNVDGASVPSEEDYNAAEAAVVDDPSLSFIEPADDVPRGNFVLAQEENGNLRIMQVDPELKITIRFPEDDDGNVTISPSNTVVAGDDFQGVDWTEVTNPFTVRDTEINIVLHGMYDGTPISVSILQRPIDQNFVVTAQRR